MGNKIKLTDVVPQRRNANKHSERGLGALESSIQKDGWIGAITVAADGETFDGSARIETGVSAGFEDAIIIESDGSKPVIHRRTDIPNADDPRAVRLGIAANRVAELNLEWDADTLQTLEPELLSPMFSDKELAEILSQTGVEPKDAEVDINKAAELQQKWQVATGEIIQIGGHVLACGDCTNPSIRQKLLGNTKSAIISDPPYGIDLDTSWLSALHVQHGKPPNKSDDRLANDDGTLDLSWAYAWPKWLLFGFPYLARNENYSGLLVWDKRGDGGESGLGNPVEIAASNAFNGYRLKRHVWAGFVREAGEKREPHPTQKPIGIMLDALALVKGDVFDPFAGSGTTLVAAENAKRKCYAVELKPEYCSTILERMSTAFPNLKIERHEVSTERAA